MATTRSFSALTASLVSSTLSILPRADMSSRSSASRRISFASFSPSCRSRAFLLISTSAALPRCVFSFSLPFNAMAEEGADTKEALASRPRTTVPILMLISSSLPYAER